MCKKKEEGINLHQKEGEKEKEDENIETLLS